MPFALRKSVSLSYPAARPPVHQHTSPTTGTSIVSGNHWRQANVTIKNRLGMHARPAMSFVDIANTFRSDIRVRKGDQEVDGKSIMQMMMLAAGQGTALIIKARGEDAQDAIDALRDLVERSFDEE